MRRAAAAILALALGLALGAPRRPGGRPGGARQPIRGNPARARHLWRRPQLPRRGAALRDGPVGPRHDPVGTALRRLRPPRQPPQGLQPHPPQRRRLRPLRRLPVPADDGADRLLPAWPAASVSTASFQPGFSHAEEAASPGLYEVRINPAARCRHRRRPDRYDQNRNGPLRVPRQPARQRPHRRRRQCPARRLRRRLRRPRLAAKSPAPPPAASSAASARATGSTSRRSSTAASTPTGPGKAKALDRGGDGGRRHPVPAGEPAHHAPRPGPTRPSTPVGTASSAPGSAISFVSVEGARANLAAESGGRGFGDDRAARAQALEPGAGADPGQRRPRPLLDTFYTALYHAFLAPRTFNDVGGAYPGWTGRSTSARGYTQYADFSGWDTYRTQVQLLALLAPERASDMMKLAARRRRARAAACRAGPTPTARA